MNREILLIPFKLRLCQICKTAPLPCAEWACLVALLRLSVHSYTLWLQVVMKSIQNLLQTNVSVCTSLGQPFMTQFNIIFTDMLQVGGHYVYS